MSTAANATLLAATNGAERAVDNLSFAGPGGFDIENRGDAVGTAGKGIFVDLSDDQTGAVTLVLNKVTVSGVASHGGHASDCDLADDCGGGGAGGGSDGSIVVHATGLTIDDAGNGTFDADGLRVDERGASDIHLIAHDSLFSNVGADGLDLDEGQDGDVIVSVVGSRLVTNGAYCHPDLLGGFMPEEEEGEFEEGEMAEAEIPGMVFEEEDGGGVNVTAMGVSTSGSDDGELGLEVVQDDDGAGDLSLSGSDIADGVEAEGVEMSEMQAATPRPARRPRPRRGLLRRAQARSNGLGSRGFETAWQAPCKAPGPSRFEAACRPGGLRNALRRRWRRGRGSRP